MQTFFDIGKSPFYDIISCLIIYYHMTTKSHTSLLFYLFLLLDPTKISYWIQLNTVQNNMNQWGKTGNLFVEM